MAVRALLGRIGQWARREFSIRAEAPFIPPKNYKEPAVYDLPPFGTNPPKPPIVTTPADYAEREIHNDPRELWYLALPAKLTPMQCLQILRSALGGDLWQQWQLCSLMLDTWPVFRMAQHQLREAVSYVKYLVKPYCEEGDEASESASEKASLVRRNFAYMKPSPFNDERNFSGMVYDLTDAMLNGLSLQELLWTDAATKRYGRERLIRSSAWVHPRHFTYTNDGFIAVFDDNYARLYANPELTNAGSIGTAPDPNKFLCSQFISRSGSALGAGLMRPLVWLWSARTWNNEWMLNTAKQFGSPFIDVTYKSGTDQAAINNLDAMLKTAGANRRLIHIEGTEAQIHPATSLGQDNPQRYLREEADREALFLLLGQEGTTKATPGKLGDEGTHQDVADERKNGLAKWVATNVLSQAASAILRLNYGDDEECPTIEPDFTVPLSPQEVANFLTAVATATIPLRAEDVYAKAGMAIPEEGDMVVKEGQLVFMSAVQSEDEIEQQEMEQEQQQQADQMHQQQLELKMAQPPGPSGPVAAALKGAMRKASKEELAELNELIVKARQAPKRNGEWEQVAIKVHKLRCRRTKQAVMRQTHFREVKIPQ